MEEVSLQGTRVAYSSNLPYYTVLVKAGKGILLLGYYILFI
jgi:hypothetical protein